MSTTRKINLYSTAGKVDKSGFESSATTRAELIKELDALGINTKGQSITEFHNQAELTEHSVLPEGDLKLYIMPAQVKSGKLVA